MLNDVTVFNIREYLSAKGDKDLGEDELRQLLSEFFVIRIIMIFWQITFYYPLN